MKVEKMDWITRDIVRDNRDKLFLFGDNLQRVGMGGQAGAMRGEPNAVGIATKKTPSGDDSAFFTDDAFEENCRLIDRDLNIVFGVWLKLVAEYCTDQVPVVIPTAGLGTGLAELDTRAPRTFEYLEHQLAKLEAPVA